MQRTETPRSSYADILRRKRDVPSLSSTVGVIGERRGRSELQVRQDTFPVVGFGNNTHPPRKTLDPSDPHHTVKVDPTPTPHPPVYSSCAKCRYILSSYTESLCSFKQHELCWDCYEKDWTLWKNNFFPIR